MREIVLTVQRAFGVRSHVYDIIDGRRVRAHGDTEMPIWGDAFRSGPADFDEETARKRIEAMVSYLRAVQRRKA